MERRLQVNFDMPTLDEWEQALSLPRSIRVESSPQLIQEVQERTAKKEAARQKRGQAIPPRKGPLSEVAVFAPEQQVQIIPAYMLLRLGLVTTPVVENLADISSTWAYFRYLWAFDIPTGGSNALRLSDAARNIDFHQKGLLSDQIGVGIAAVLLDKYLNAPQAADVSVAVSDPFWPVDLQYDTSPDYLFFDSSQTNLFIVECKGTQGSRSTSLDQLRRGTEQVPSLVFTDGRTPQSLIVATCLAKNDTTVLVLDPPADDDLPPSDRMHTERIGQRSWRVRDDAGFSRSTRLISESKILSFAGDYEAATAKSERAQIRTRGRFRSLSPEPTFTENEFGRFRGVRQRLGVRDRFDVEVFQGVETTVYEALLSDDPERTTAEMQVFARRSSEGGRDIEQKQPVRTATEKGSVVVRAAGSDGALLEVRVSPR